MLNPQSQPTNLSTHRNYPSKWLWFSCSFLIILLDQISKYLADRFLPYGVPQKFIPFLNLWLTYNPGAAFSFLGTAGPWRIVVLSGISILIAIVIIVWLFRIPRSNWFVAMALSLVLGGAIGNLIDRLRLQYVIDFFDFYIGQWHFFIFNVADAAAFVGATLLVIKWLFFGNRKDQ